MCGAAALRMVYLSFGIDVSQPLIWPRVSRHDGCGIRSARTHLLAADAERRGLRASIIQADCPREVLARCWDHDIRVILNHRPHAASRAGHYSVLAGVDERGLEMHDPQAGPARQIAWDEWIELWRPNHPESEIAGQIMVALWRDETIYLACQTCGQTLPESIACANCGRALSLHPVPLGCGIGACPARLWRRLYCPGCDRPRLAREAANPAPLALTKQLNG